MTYVIPRPPRELLEGAAANLGIYGLLRRAFVGQSGGRDLAFAQWCEILELNPLQRAQVAHVRITLIQRMHLGQITYDDIDWSGEDEDLRASSTGTIWIDDFVSGGV